MVTAALWLAVMVGSSAAKAAEPELALSTAGAFDTVFTWARDRCDDADIPDAPARAFRDASGQVHLIAAHDINRARVGPSLAALRKDCGIVYRGRDAADPAAYDDRTWLTAFYTADGRTVAALGHSEFHGHLRPGLCPAAQYRACWWNAVTAALSRDGGTHFERTAGAESIVAALPYRYEPVGRPVGYFSPSNIVTFDGAAYAFIFAEAYRDQKRGACLLRTTAPMDAATWRAWDGVGFASKVTVQGCAPVPGLDATVTSVVRHRSTGILIALIAARRATAGGGAMTGIYYATSRDLLHWSEARLLFPAPLMFDFACGVPAAYGYPSLLDQRSDSRNFDEVGDAADLYLTRFNLRECRLVMDRDLVRAAVRIETYRAK